MSKIFVDQVDPKTATTLTLGTSGDTVDIPSGVTIANSGTATGFFSATDITGQTALDDVPALTDEFVISDGGALKRIDANFVMNTPSFYAYKTATDSVATATYITLVPTSVAQNDGTCYDTSNGRFTVPSNQDGLYFFFGSFRINGYSPGRCQCVLSLNGGDLNWTLGESVPDGSVSSGSIYPTIHTTAMMALSAADYVQVRGLQTSGGTNDIFNSVFGGFKIR